jgi:hypothetical protein
MARFRSISYRSPIFSRGAHDPEHFARILNLTFKMECHMTFHLSRNFEIKRRTSFYLFVVVWEWLIE